MRFHLVPLAFACIVAIHAETEPITEFRKNLADNGKYPLRRGNQLDLERLKQAVRQAHSQNLAKLFARYSDSLNALPHKATPVTEGYEVILTTQDIIHYREALLVSTTLTPDVRKLTQFTLTSVLPMTLATELGLNMEEVGAWIAFLSIAEPEWYRCGGDAVMAIICLSYGGVDIFAVSLEAEGGTPVLKRISWYRKKSSPSVIPKRP